MIRDTQIQYQLKKERKGEANQLRYCDIEKRTCEKEKIID